MTLKDDNVTSRQDEGFTERRHHRNLSLQEDDITKRQPYKKTGRRPYWKMTSACLASQSFPELGPAQPQLVSSIVVSSTARRINTCPTLTMTNNHPTDNLGMISYANIPFFLHYDLSLSEVHYTTH